jgi:hypothetical protein
MASFQRRSTRLFLTILLICWLLIRLDTAPANVNDHPADTGFNVSNAFTHLQNIAREPHALGTAANDSVRQYIVSACQSLGLEVVSPMPRWAC